MMRLVSWLLMIVLLALSGPVQAGVARTWLARTRVEGRSRPRTLPVSQTVEGFSRSRRASYAPYFDLHQTDKRTHGPAPSGVEQNGTMLATRDYGDYGTTTQTSGDHGLYQPMLYTHCELDAETGFYHNRARHYAPKFGKFLARDPIASNNLYSYCHGDPVNFSDPSGLNEELRAMLAGLGTVVSSGTFTILTTGAPIAGQATLATGSAGLTAAFVSITEAGPVAAPLAVGGGIYVYTAIYAPALHSAIFPYPIPIGPSINLSNSKFGHTFQRHGAGATTFCERRMEALFKAGKASDQGQWLDDQAAAEFILNNLHLTKNVGLVNITLPSTVPARILTPNGPVSATHAILNPGKSGVTTAYPTR